MKKIEIPNGEYVIVDDEDYPVLSRLKWHVGNNDGSVYHCLNFPELNTSMPMHYLLLPKTNSNDFRLVHLNGNNLDYRKENLEYRRIGDIVHNAKKKVEASSIYKGVYCDYEFNRWRAYITKDYKRIWLGSFRTEKEAALAYNKKAKELYGELAYQNPV